MSAPSVTITVSTVRPLMSMPRISAAFSPASSGERASLTPPALPRPPVLTCALTTTTGVPSSLAASTACSGVLAVMPRSTGTPWASKISRAWYSNRSIRGPPEARAADVAAFSAGWWSIVEPSAPAPGLVEGRRAGGPSPLPDLALRDVLTDPRDDVGHARPRAEHPRDASFEQLSGVGGGDDPAAE